MSDLKKLCKETAKYINPIAHEKPHSNPFLDRDVALEQEMQEDQDAEEARWEYEMQQAALCKCGSHTVKTMTYEQVADCVCGVDL